MSKVRPAPAEARFRSLVEQLTCVVFETDSQGRWTWLNPAWTEITGHPVADSLGRMFIEFVHPADRERNAELFAPLMERTKEFCRHEVRYLCADGGHRWIEVHARLLLDETGTARGTAGTLTDVTRRREAEEALQRAKRRYEHVLATAPSVLYAMRLGGSTPAWDYVSENVADLFGHPADRMVQDPAFWRNCAHPDDRESLEDGFAGLLASGRHTREFRLKKGNGDYCWVRDTGILVRSPSGEPAEIIGSWTDVTAERERELQMRRLATMEAARSEAESGERRFQAMLESISDGFFSVGDDCSFTYLNATAERLLGRTRDSLLGRSVRGVLPDSVCQVMQPGSDAGEVSELEHFDSSSGRWYGVRIYRRPGGRSVFFHDVTARRAADSETRQRAALHEALAAVSAGFAASAAADLTAALGQVATAIAAQRAYVFELRDGARRLCNTEEWCATGTQPVIHLLGDLPVELFPWWMAELADDRAIVLGSLDDIPPGENATRRTLQEQGVQALLVVPMRSTGGELLGFVGFDDTCAPRSWKQEEIQILRVVADLVGTQLSRRQAEHALRRSERDYRGLFEHAQDAILILDPSDERVLDANSAACALYGLTRERFLGMSLRDLSVDPDRGQQHLRATLDGGGTYSFETVQHRADGREIVLEVRAAVIEYRDRPAVLSVNRDVTARRQLELEFRQAQKMEAVGQLAGGVAHDFNNMLTAIGGYAELMLLDERPDEDREQLEEIARAAQRATRLTHQLLAFSRKQVLRPTVLQPDRVVSDMSAMLRRLIGESVRLSVVSSGITGCILADEGQLQQVIMNLVVNARDAMPDGGSVTIETSNIVLEEPFGSTHVEVAPGRYVVVSVSDNGSGMDEQTRERAFDPFFTTKETGKGTGLGLSTVYGIVRQSGGHVFIYSEVNRGTTVKLYLPRVDAAEEQAQTGAAPPLQGGSGRILLVEDEDLVRQIARTTLEKAGYDLVEASSADDAIRLIEDGLPRPDLLITDVVMPGSSGRVLAEFVDRRWPGLLVLFMSGYTDDAVVRHGVLQHGVPFIQKPFTPSSFTRRVGEMLSTRPELRR